MRNASQRRHNNENARALNLQVLVKLSKAVVLLDAIASS